LFEIRLSGFHSRGYTFISREDDFSAASVYQKQKTPSAEIRLALKRQQEMLDEQEDD
jgi:hypothetical protein